MRGPVAVVGFPVLAAAPALGQLAPGWPADDRPGQSLDRQRGESLDDYHRRLEQWRNSSHDERREMLDRRPGSGRNDEEPEE
jgi:hypothetical protein